MSKSKTNYLFLNAMFLMFMLIIVPGLYALAVCQVCIQFKLGVPAFLALLFGALVIYLALLRHRIFHLFEALGF